jgi:glutamine cyclotransferase
MMKNKIENSKKYWLIFFFVLIFWGINFGNKNQGSINLGNNVVHKLSYSKMNVFPHDTNSFTEGFLVYNGEIYESTGAPRDLSQTKSLFGIVDLETGKIDTKVEIDRNKYFGEGIAILHGKIYQLTYKSKIGFVYDIKTYEQISQFSLPGNEGWGLTTDKTYLIMSDGSSELNYLDPQSLQVVKTIQVTENGYPKDRLNELEYIKGYLYANIWLTNIIVKIDPLNGNIVGKLDLEELANEAKKDYAGALEMNGIAYDFRSEKIYITGKLWPSIFEIKID